MGKGRSVFVIDRATPEGEGGEGQGEELMHWKKTPRRSGVYVSSG